MGQQQVLTQLIERTFAFVRHTMPMTNVEQGEYEWQKERERVIDDNADNGYVSQSQPN